MIQTEKNEIAFLPSLEFSKVAATRLHSAMKDDVPTDFFPDGTYIFSDARHMRLKRRDFDDAIIDIDIPEYKEGQNPTQLKIKTFADKYFTKHTNTPAQIASRIQKVHRVITDKEQTYNPFIQQANRWNKENRIIPVQMLIDISEDIKPVDSPTIIDKETEKQQMEIKKFKSGGWSKNKYQSFGEVFGGVASGAGAGAMFGPIGAGVGALAGGLGTWIVGSEAKRDALKRQKELENLNAKRRVNLENSNNAAMFTTAAKASVPVSRYHYLDTSNQQSRASSAYDRAALDTDITQKNVMSNVYSPSNTLVRNLSSLGLNPSQSANVVNNTLGNTINSANSLQAGFSADRNKLNLDKMTTLNSYDDITARDRQVGQNLQADKIYSKTTGAINEFGANQQSYLSNKDQLMLDEYEMTTALQSANSTERANKLGLFNNTLSQLGNAATTALPGLTLEGRNKVAEAIPDMLKGDVLLKDPKRYKVDKVMSNSGNNYTISDYIVDSKTGVKYVRMSDGTWKRQ